MRNLLRRASCVAGMLALLLILEAGAQEWTRFRGPNGTGISDAKGIPVAWTEKDFKWKVATPGESHSQPVLWGDKIFLTSAVDQGKERMLLCFAKEDGKELWTKKYPLPTHPPGNRYSGFANGSPAVDKERVYACFVSAEQFLVKAYDHEGKDVWSVNLGPFESQHGHGASPIVYEEKLIVVNDQDGESSIVALEVKTGKTVWKCPRRGVKQNTAYGTPMILERKGQPAIILTTSHSHGVSALDPKIGSMLWESPGIFDKRSVASPVVAGDLVFGSCGSGGGGNFMVAVHLGGKVAYTFKDKIDKKEIAPYVPTPITLGNRLFAVGDSGVAFCLEASSGKEIWKETLLTAGNFFCSPILIDGKIYCCSTKGEMIVFAAADQFKLLARNPVGEGSHSTPCVDGDRLYLKTFTHLVCIGK